MKNRNQNLSKAKPIFVIWLVLKSLLANYLHKNKMLIKVSEKMVRANKFIIRIIASDIQKKFHILKQEDMQGKEMPRVHILLKNGRDLKENSEINVLFAERKRSLQKIISNLFRLVEQIIFQISSHYVVLVIVENGKKLIYENPEILKEK